jgi:hypothetical protein
MITSACQGVSEAAGNGPDLIIREVRPEVRGYPVAPFSDLASAHQSCLCLVPVESGYLVLVGAHLLVTAPVDCGTDLYG